MNLVGSTFQLLGRERHNPMELLSTTAVWSGGRVTIYEATQGAQAVKQDVAKALALDPAIIDVKCSYIGGGFGQKRRSTTPDRAHRPPRGHDAAIAVLREAIEAGVDHIDTSDFYYL